MKRFYSLLMLIFAFSLFSFIGIKSEGISSGKVKTYKAEFVIKELRDETQTFSKPTLFSRVYKKITVELDKNNRISKVSSLENIEETEILNSFIGEKINFNNEIAYTTERSDYKKYVHDNRETTKLLEYYIHIKVKNIVEY